MGDTGSGFRMRRFWMVAGALGALTGAGAAIGAPNKPVPYWASISQDEARMLPVKVVQVLGLWRKVEDPDGAQGWMHVRLLSDTPTAIVKADVAPMHESASDGAASLYRAERGVVGRLSDCSREWCAFDVKGRRGYVKASDLWGATDK